MVFFAYTNTRNSKITYQKLYSSQIVPFVFRISNCVNKLQTKSLHNLRWTLLLSRSTRILHLSVSLKRPAKSKTLVRCSVTQYEVRVYKRYPAKTKPRIFGPSWYLQNLTSLATWILDHFWKSFKICFKIRHLFVWLQRGLNFNSKLSSRPKAFM